jgi:hypothetical protein
MQIGPQEEDLIQYIGKARLNKKVPERVNTGVVIFSLWQDAFEIIASRKSKKQKVLPIKPSLLTIKMI